MLYAPANILHTLPPVVVLYITQSLQCQSHPSLPRKWVCWKELKDRWQLITWIALSPPFNQRSSDGFVQAGIFVFASLYVCIFCWLNTNQQKKVMTLLCARSQGYMAIWNCLESLHTPKTLHFPSNFWNISKWGSVIARRYAPASYPTGNKLLLVQMRVYICQTLSVLVFEQMSPSHHGPIHQYLCSVNQIWYIPENV